MKIAVPAIILTFLFSIVQGQFQPSQVEKSTQVIRYQGINYHIHTVKQGQTLYRICQTYEVTEEEISQANPGVSLSPLSIGQVLKIPSIANQSDISNKKPVEKNFILHVVKAKETPYFLHKKYDVPLEVIYNYNPGSENGIGVGQTIRIPGNYKGTAPIYHPKEQQESYTNYRVKQGDTLYRISKTYNISISDLIVINPELRWGLKKDQLLRIPGADLLAEDYLHDGEDSILSVLNYEKLSRYQCDSIRSLKRMPPPVKVALLLPFFTKDALAPEFQETDSLTRDHNPTILRKKRLKGRVSTEFYEGFLLSLDTLRKKGMNISLFVFDTEGDTNKVKKILNDLEIVEPDVIIGPLSPYNIQLVSQFSFERKIPFVPPLATNDTLFANNPYLFRIIPSTHSEQIAYTDFLVDESISKNIILVYKPNLKYDAEIDSFKTNYLAKLAEKTGLDTLLLTEVLIDDHMNVNLDSALHDTKENLVFINSSYEPDVINALSRLHFLKREHSIKVYGMPAWQKFDNIRIDVMHELQVTLHTPFYIDYQKENVNNFVNKCRDKLKYEPYMTASKGTGINYAFLGYDIGMYYLRNISSYGKNTCACVEYNNENLLLSAYGFKRNPLTGSLENTSFSFITFDDDYIVKPTPPAPRQYMTEY